jgi:hypothetical protein
LLFTVVGKKKREKRKEFKEYVKRKGKEKAKVYYDFEIKRA